MSEPISTEELYRLYWDEQLGPKEISEMTGLNPIAICARFHRAGYKMRTRAEAQKLYQQRHRRKVCSEKQIDQMVYLYTERGWPTSQIGDEFYISPSTVCGYLHDRGIVTDHRTMRKDRPSYKKTVQMWEAYWGYNLTMKEVGQLFGLHYSSVSARFKAAGLKIRTKAETGKMVHARAERKSAKLKLAA